MPFGKISAKEFPQRSPFVRKKKKRIRKPKPRNTLTNKVNTLIKNMPVPEKKYVNFGTVDFRVGQLDGVGFDGVDFNDVTPIIVQGTNYFQRNGNMIKPTGAYYRFNVSQQANTVNTIQYNVSLWRVIGATQTGPQALVGIFDTDPITGFRDYNAPRNPNQFKQYRCIFSRNYTLKPDKIAGQTGIMDMHVPIKLGNYTMRWDTSGGIQEGQLFMCIRANSGNYNAASNTGAVMKMSYRFSYVDV
jgi:hypothetical protein